jgi:hypothetical protein
VQPQPIELCPHSVSTNREAIVYLAGWVDDWRELLRDDPQEMDILREKYVRDDPAEAAFSFAKQS